MNKQERDEIMQAVFDASPNGLAVLKVTFDSQKKPIGFIVMLLNGSALHLTGAGEDYEGRPLADVFKMVPHAEALSNLIQVAESGIRRSFEISFSENHNTTFFRFTAVRQQDLLVVTFEDTTEIRNAENLLSEALERTELQRRLYTSITDNTPDLLYAFDLNYKFTYANKALLTMWGKTFEDSVGKGLRENGYEEWHALMHEKEIDEVAATKKPIRGTVSFSHAELGERVYDYIFSPVLGASGGVEAIAGSTRDITDLKQFEIRLTRSEARLRSLIDQTPAPTLALRGDDFILEQVNAPMLEMIGRGPDIIGQPLLKVLPELEGQFVWEQVKKVYYEGIAFHQTEVLVPHNRNGKTDNHYYNLAYRPLVEAGKITGMIQVAIDVTEHVKARQEMAESEQRLRALSQSLEEQVAVRTAELKRSNADLLQFAHVASHDLKEPVRKILLFTERLDKKLEDKLGEEEKKFTQRIKAAAERMASMIEGVLHYSTVNSDEESFQPVDLNRTLSLIEEDLELKLEGAGANIINNGLPVVDGAPILLYQLFYNLINNSIKFAAENTPPVITLDSHFSASVDAVIITLADNGIGFDDAFSEKIFETFTRLNAKDRYEGTGLGLALCKKITDRHRGQITAAGRPGGGAVFTITLPAHQNTKTQ